MSKQDEEAMITSRLPCSGKDACRVKLPLVTFQLGEDREHLICQTGNNVLDLSISK